MRAAIRKGLECLKAGDGAEPIMLDGELSAEVGKLAVSRGWTRQRVLLEALRIGIGAVFSRATRAAEAPLPNEAPEDVKASFLMLAHHDSDAHPIIREHAGALSAIRALQYRFNDLVSQVPEAAARLQLMEKVTALRALPGHCGGGPPYGLTPQEMHDEIARHEEQLAKDFPEAHSNPDGPAAPNSDSPGPAQPPGVTPPSGPRPSKPAKRKPGK